MRRSGYIGEPGDARGERGGFTLIELLVVIAIIALLVGILLPALKSARENGRTTVCGANFKQVVTGFLLYAQDYKQIPGIHDHGPANSLNAIKNLDWIGKNNENYTTAPPGTYTHPLQASGLGEYLTNVDRILACPTAQRQANGQFDYTMLAGMAGARTEVNGWATYPKDPSAASSPRVRFEGMPLMIEEHDKFYNGNPLYMFGKWTNIDQFSHRHAGKAHIGYFEGHVLLFDAPHGARDDVEEARDLVANDLWLHVNTRVFMQLGRSNNQRYGWINGPVQY